MIMNEIKVGVISDVHSNYHAFKVCVDYMKAQGITDFILLGDYVSDTADTVKTMELLYELIDNNHVSLLRGNREEYMLEQWKIRKGQSEGSVWLKNSASGNLLYTFDRLTERDFQFFDRLPITFRYEKSGFPAITCCHGSPDNARELMELYGENTREWMKKVDAEYLMAAHTHFPGELHEYGKTYINCGCVGVAIGDAGFAQCAILHGVEDNQKKRWVPEFLRLPYDTELVVKHIIESGLLDMGKWFVNGNIHILKTGLDYCAQMVAMANELASADSNGTAQWPYIDERYFEQAARHFGVPDYREL